MISQEKPGRGMDRHTRALWGQGVSAFNDLVATLKFEWVERRRESVHLDRN
jgi:hypothetical protein